MFVANFFPFVTENSPSDKVYEAVFRIMCAGSWEVWLAGYLPYPDLEKKNRR
jgi:hypothetical protein